MVRSYKIVYSIWNLRSNEFWDLKTWSNFWYYRILTQKEIWISHYISAQLDISRPSISQLTFWIDGGFYSQSYKHPDIGNLKPAVEILYCSEVSFFFPKFTYITPCKLKHCPNGQLKPKNQKTKKPKSVFFSTLRYPVNRQEKSPSKTQRRKRKVSFQLYYMSSYSLSQRQQNLKHTRIV